jgi:hypothetical protein
MDKQTGSLGPDSIDDWAGHWTVDKTLATAPVKPKVFIEFNYASGTKSINFIPPPTTTSILQTRSDGETSNNCEPEWKTVGKK